MQPKTILIVEDDAELRSMIRLLLESEGFAFDCAENGEEALRKIETHLPDLILLDMSMPVMDGWEFARRFHETYDRSVPIVIMSAVPDLNLIAEQIGADGFIRKPFPIDDLISIIRGAIDKQAVSNREQKEGSCQND